MDIFAPDPCCHCSGRCAHYQEIYSFCGCSPFPRQICGCDYGSACQPLIVMVVGIKVIEDTVTEVGQSSNSQVQLLRQLHLVLSDVLNDLQNSFSKFAQVVCKFSTILVCVGQLCILPQLQGLLLFPRILQAPVQALIHPFVAHGDFIDHAQVSFLHEVSC